MRHATRIVLPLLMSVLAGCQTASTIGGDPQLEASAEHPSAFSVEADSQRPHPNITATSSSQVLSRITVSGSALARTYIMHGRGSKKLHTASAQSSSASSILRILGENRKLSVRQTYATGTGSSTSWQYEIVDDNGSILGVSGPCRYESRSINFERGGKSLFKLVHEPAPWAHQRWSVTSSQTCGLESGEMAMIAAWIATDEDFE